MEEINVSGYFISFEGSDGSGKTSVLKKIIEFLDQKGQQAKYLLTREPGGNKISEEIRQVILDVKNTQMSAKTEALLYAAARSQHLEENILPALKENKLVLCDRFVDSSIVYQGRARGLGMDVVAQLNEFATDKLSPELTIYFDVDPRVGLARIVAGRTNEVNRLDQEDLSFYDDVRAAYQELAQKYPDRIVTINANQELEQVVADVFKVLAKRVPAFFEA
ncbi:thymidylate kinase [Ligilactobacillus equi DSM 15833 = JCM 10991]|nr:thymidylate kinase [Ligilactobacillus equi DSM 15833 = JCM 10991]